MVSLRLHNHFGKLGVDFAYLLVCRSQNRVNDPWGGETMGRGTGHRKLDKFEKLIRDAIAILIKRGEISIPRKKPFPSKTKPKKESQ